MIANYLKENTTKVGEGEDGDEYIIIRLDHVVPAINIVSRRAGLKRIQLWLAGCG